MSLQITKTINNRTANYWDIVQFYFNDDEKFLQAELRGYENKAKRDEAKTGVKTALINLRFSFSGTDYPNTNQGNLIKTIENKIRQSTLYGGWSNATVVQ